VDACPRDPVLRLAALLCEARPRDTQSSSADEAVAETICQRLRVSNADRGRVATLVRHRAIDPNTLASDAALRRWLARVGRASAGDVLELSRADAAASNSAGSLEAVEALGDRARALLDAQTPLSVRELSIGGHELVQELRLEPGPIVGRTLGQLLELVLDEPGLNTPKRLLDAAKRLVGEA
jgi:hypothetical protein